MEKFKEILGSIQQSQQECFISSITPDGYPKTRAMLMPVKQFGNEFWFHTNTSSQKVQHFKNNPKACIYFCEADSFIGIVFTGTMAIFEDHPTKDGFWMDGYEMYYPDGKDGSDFCIMKFTALRGDFYENFSVTKFCF